MAKARELICMTNIASSACADDRGKGGFGCGKGEKVASLFPPKSLSDGLSSPCTWREISAAGLRQWIVSLPLAKVFRHDVHLSPQAMLQFYGFFLPLFFSLSLFFWAQN